MFKVLNDLYFNSRWKIIQTTTSVLNQIFSLLFSRSVASPHYTLSGYFEWLRLDIWANTNVVEFV